MRGFDRAGFRGFSDQWAYCIITKVWRVFLKSLEKVERIVMGIINPRN